MLLLLVLACSSSAARAASGEHVNLAWRAPASPDCPPATYVLQEIRRYVGETPARAPIDASATIRSVGLDRWQLVLVTKDGEAAGERTLQGESCRAVADAAVVVLAWMVDNDAMANRLLPLAPDRPPPSSPPSPERPRPAATRAPRTTAFVGVGPVGDFGTLPWPALGAEARGGAALGRFRLALHAAYWPSRSKTSATLSDGRAAGAKFTLRLLGVEACVQPWPSRAGFRWELAVCAGPELDEVRGVGFGVNESTAGSKTWLSFTAAVSGRVSLTAAVHVALSIASVLPTEREHFALRGVGEVYRPAALAGRASAGLELDL